MNTDDKNVDETKEHSSLGFCYQHLSPSKKRCGVLGRTIKIASLFSGDREDSKQHQPSGLIAPKIRGLHPSADPCNEQGSIFPCSQSQSRIPGNGKVSILHRPQRPRLDAGVSKEMAYKVDNLVLECGSVKTKQHDIPHLKTTCRMTYQTVENDLQQLLCNAMTKVSSVELFKVWKRILEFLYRQKSSCRVVRWKYPNSFSSLLFIQGKKINTLPLWCGDSLVPARCG